MEIKLLSLPIKNDACFFYKYIYIKYKLIAGTPYGSISLLVLQVTSQHPYAEAIGEPYVWMVDMHNSTDVERALTAILNQTVSLHMVSNPLHSGNMLNLMNTELQFVYNISLIVVLHTHFRLSPTFPMSFPVKGCSRGSTS